MAAPFVAGAAALLLAEYPGLKPVEVMNQIEQTARGTALARNCLRHSRALNVRRQAGGSHIFHALHPGEYVVSVTHYDEALRTWEVSSKPISLGIGEEVEVRFQFGS